MKNLQGYAALISLGWFLLLASMAKGEPDHLQQGFDKPPESAKPRTWWHWVSGNVSREGITADLEAMKQIGLGGFQNFTAEQSDVKGSVKFMSPEWQDLVKFSMNEAHRLKLEMSMEGCDGWSESGGPWVTPAESMQKVVWSEIAAHEGDKVDLRNLPEPEVIRDYYQDIAIFAVPAAGIPVSIKPISLTVSSDSGPIDPAPLVGGSANVSIKNLSDKPLWAQYDLGQPTQMGHARLNQVHRLGSKLSWELLSSNDGITFTKVVDLSEMDDRSFAPVTARYFRLSAAQVPEGVPEVTLKAFSLGPVVLDRLDGHTGIACNMGVNTFREDASLEGRKIDLASIVNLTGMKAWSVPAGEWRIIRLGHTSTGVGTHPSTSGGLECDKLSTEAVEHHIDHLFGPLVKASPERIGSTFKYILLDSWEAGCENWTDGLPAEFKARRGYDPTPWLPTLTGEIIGSVELTQRFLWDYRRTLADLVAENHYGTFQTWAHRHQMGLTSEATGIGMPTVADQLLCKKYTDIPMGEFWVNRSREDNIDDPKEAASAAHLYGQNLAATESFTSIPATAAWKNDPASLKALGDEEFCLGVNRFVFHRYAHQPWLDRVPGMSMGPWGINFERTNTWWQPGSAWITYLSRCQFLLQQGKFQADLLYYYGEGVPVCVKHASLDPAPPQGYDYDVCNADILLNQLTCHDGLLTLPSGMVYRVLILPKSDRMTLPVLKKIKALVEAGATVYGPKPLLSPSLTGYPESDQEIKTIADAVWGNCDGQQVKEHACGKGRIVWGAPLDQAMGVAPDFAHDTGDLLYIHRQDGPADIYFISNQEAREVTAQVSFRVSGKVPEFWHPDTGKRETVALAHEADGRTTLPIHFDPTGSVFVIFRQPAADRLALETVQYQGQKLFTSAPVEAVPAAELPVLDENGMAHILAWKAGTYSATTSQGKTLLGQAAALPEAIVAAGPWQITFPPKRGAPATANFDHLISWPDSPDEGIKYFSGTATYHGDLSLPDNFLGAGRHVYLDLGEVKNLAEVSLNGKALGILWKVPFRLDITSAAVSGLNHLELKITNLWPNRLIGDQKLPKDQQVTWTSVSLYKADAPLLPSGLLGPVRVIPAVDVMLKP